MRSRRQGARRSDLGRLLADLRMAKGLSLRRVEEVTRNTVSNSYLSQLESGKIHKPSPNVLRSLAAVFAVPYETLRKPSETEDASMPAYAIARDHVLAALSIDEIGDALDRLARGRVVSV